MEFLGTVLSTLASSMLELVMQKLCSSLETNIGLVLEVDKNLGELNTTYMNVQAMLDKLDCWQINSSDMEPCLQNLVRCCYDTEDLVDYLNLSPPIKQQDEEPVPTSLHWKIFKSGRWTIPRQIAELQKNLEDLARQIDSILPERPINSTHLPIQGKPSPNCKNPLLDRMPPAARTSRDNDKETIILELTSLQRNPSGVSIIGMDGLGKTVLARTILNNEEITNHFPLILSACVSGDFKMEDIVQKLVEDHSRRTRPHSNSQPYEPHQNDLMLQGILCSGKSLIILDDLWRVTDEDWEEFRCNYLKLSPDWKILITTRNLTVAEVTETTPFYLNKMTDEDCKKLIIHSAKQSILETEIWSDDIEFIAKKCKGMPIIANKLGLRLSKKRERELTDTITEFKTKEIWNLEEFIEVFPSLNLNVPKLPPDHKRCFAYCSLFSPDHEFNKDDLMQLWEVEGFIEPQQTSQCFDDLLSRSILHPYESRSKGQGIYKMHELNQEFAHRLSSKAVCRVGEGTSNLLSSDNIRHLSLTCQNIDEPLLKKIERCKGLRTFLLLHQYKPITRTISRNFFQKLQRLRLLDLSHTNIISLPNPMSPSMHLRYLDLSYTKVKELPGRINIFRALQILKLKDCPELLQLPNDLTQLISLKHFHVNMKILGCPPSNLGRLTNLQTLDSFLVGNGERFKVSELKNMAHLKEVHISGLENIGDMEEAEEAMLSQKSSLRTLVLEWGRSVENAGAVLQGLQPHNDLQDLVVRNYCGQIFPPWLTFRSCQLVSVYLDNCQNCQVLPSLGQLPILKTAVIRSIHNVKIVDNNFYGPRESKSVFPCLELLEFRDMSGLADWTGLEAGDMPRLRALKIVNCPRLVNLPSLENLSCLLNIEITNCPMLQSSPELPLSLKDKLEEHNALVKERCQIWGADWWKFKGIPYVKIDATRALAKSSNQPRESDKDKVPTNEHQPSTSTKLFNENTVPQDPWTLSEDQPASPQLQPTTTSQMAGKNHNLQDEMERNKGHPPEPFESHDLQNEGPRSKGEFQDMSNVMLASLHEGQRSKRKFQDLSAEIAHSLWSSGVPLRSSAAGTSIVKKKRGVLKAFTKEQCAKLSTMELERAYKETRNMSCIMVPSVTKVMGIDYPNPISQEEMDNWLLQDQIGAVHISIYCSILQEKIRNQNLQSRFQFLCPHKITNRNYESDEDRARYILERIASATPHTIYLGPINISGHWMLFGLWPIGKKVWFLDPLKLHVRDQIKDLVNTAYTMWILHRGENVSEMTLQWIVVRTCAKQPNIIDCGYYVCKYMDEIIARGNQEKCCELNHGGDYGYSQEDLDDLREEWLAYVLRHRTDDDKDDDNDE